MVAPQSIQSESIAVMDNLWTYHEKGLKQIQEQFEKLPVWRRSVAMISKVAAIISLGGCLVAGVAALATFSAMPLLVGVTSSLLLTVIAIQIYQWAADAPPFIDEFKCHLEDIKNNIFVADKKLPDDVDLENKVKKVDKTVTCLEADDKDEKAEQGKHYMRLFADMPRDQVIRALKTTSVVLHLLIAIQLIQSKKLIDDPIKEHIKLAKTTVDGSELSPNCRAQIKAVSEYIEKTPKLAHIFQQEKYEPKFSDIDEIFKGLPEIKE